MTQPDNLVVIGTSHGGLAALRHIFASLPGDFPAPIMVAMHIGAYNSQLPGILQSSTRLKVKHADDGEELQVGTVYIAPPDQHMLVDGMTIKLMRGAKENYSRPAIDPLFRSAAIAHRERVIGIVLSGDLDDGTVGLQAIKACGGIALVQDPEDAIAPSMPSSALRYVTVDACLKSVQIAERLMKLAMLPRPSRGGPTQTMVLENTASLTADLTSIASLDEVAPRSPLTCPECHGVLWEMDQAPLRYRCHTGHTFGALSMRITQDTAIEELLWAAVRAFHEKEVLMVRQQEAASAGARTEQADEYALMAEQARAHARSLRGLLEAVNAETADSKRDR
jgi:two-component system chemotaxis response regulator CheB